MWCLLLLLSLTVIWIIALLPRNLESTTTPELGEVTGDFSTFNFIASGRTTTLTSWLSLKFFVSNVPNGVSHLLFWIFDSKMFTSPKREAT